MGWGAVVVSVISAASLLLLLPLPELLAALRHLLQGQGLRGLAIYGMIYTVATLLLLPGYPLTIAAGLTFGLFSGIAVVSLASTLSAALAFVAGRAATRTRVQRLASRHPRVASLDAAIGRSGWRLVALMRLAPSLPFGLLNYLFGATALRFWPYTLATWACMLPKTIMYVYLGNIAQSAAGSDPAPVENRLAWTARLIGLVASIVLALYLTHLARRATPRYMDLEGMKSFMRQQRALPGFRGWRLWVSLAIALSLWLCAFGVSLSPDAFSRRALELCSSWMGTA